MCLLYALHSLNAYNILQIQCYVLELATYKVNQKLNYMSRILWPMRGYFKLMNICCKKSTLVLTKDNQYFFHATKFQFNFTRKKFQYYKQLCKGQLVSNSTLHLETVQSPLKQSFKNYSVLCGCCKFNVLSGR